MDGTSVEIAGALIGEPGRAAGLKLVTMELFERDARAWIGVRSRESIQRSSDTWPEWGNGPDPLAIDYGVDIDFGHELQRQREWQMEKYDGGYGAITWPSEYGGLDLAPEFQRRFDRLEGGFAVATPGETLRVSLHFVAPAIRLFGDSDVADSFLRPLLRAETLACLLLSEPNAGSDLASITTTATPDTGVWKLSGQKVWTSGARYCDFGLCLARTPSDDHRRSFTAFLLPLDSPGVEIRPLRQMTGSSHFNEVFLDDVEVPDELRLGAVGDGWKVISTALAIDRADGGGSGHHLADLVELLVSFAQREQLALDPVVRQELVRLHTNVFVLDTLTRLIHSADPTGASPRASMVKLAWARATSEIGEVASMLLGPRIIADTGEWGTFGWSGQLLSAPGVHLGGGTDQIQQTILGEAVLGLPRA